MIFIRAMFIDGHRAVTGNSRHQGDVEVQLSA